MNAIMRLKFKAYLIMVIMVGITILACTGDKNEVSQPAGKGETAITSEVNVNSSKNKSIKIMDCINTNNIHVLIAAKQGFFEDEGLDVEVSYTSVGKFSMDALNSGSVDYAGVVEMNVAHTLFNTDDVAILAEFADPIKGIKVLGRGDKGVHSVQDLRGKKIGVFYGVNIHIFMTQLLESSGISLDEVELVNLRPPDAVTAFISGSIEAIISWEPLIHRCITALGENATVITEDSQAYWPYKMILTTKRSYLKDNHQEARQVLRALVRADDYIDNNPIESAQLLAEHMNLDPAIVPKFMDEIDYKIKLTPKVTEMIEYEVEWLQEYMKEYFHGKEPVTNDYQSLISNDLKHVRPENYTFPE